MNLHGRTRIGPEPFTQSIDDYVTCLHSRNGCSRDRMTGEQADRFDASVRELLLPHARGGVLELEITTHVAWGEALSAV